MKIPPWSASSIDAFRACPYKYYHLRIAKDVKDFPPSDAVLLGRRLHKAFENAVNIGERLPSEYSQWQDLVEKIKALPGIKHPEIKLAVDRNFKPVDYYSKDAWSRGAADLVILSGDTCAILDYKTGKRRDSEQLALYAAYAFAKWPHLKKVTTMYIWLKEHKIDRHTYTQEDKPELWKQWLPLVRRLELATEQNKWEATPNGLCKKYCPCVDCKYCGI